MFERSPPTDVDASVRDVRAGLGPVFRDGVASPNYISENALRELESLARRTELAEKALREIEAKPYRAEEVIARYRREARDE